MVTLASSTPWLGTRWHAVHSIVVLTLLHPSAVQIPQLRLHCSDTRATACQAHAVAAIHPRRTHDIAPSHAPPAGALPSARH
jgi:hypothetical protein